MFCFILTSRPLMLCVYLQTFEAALFWKKKKKKRLFILITDPYVVYHLSPILFILSVSSMHNIGPIIVPCFTILCNVISFVYPTGESIVAIALLFIFLIQLLLEIQLCLVHCRQHLTTIYHCICKQDVCIFVIIFIIVYYCP